MAKVVISHLVFFFTVFDLTLAAVFSVPKFPETYVAAVYEHALISSDDPETTPSREDALLLMYRNLEIYEEQTISAAEKDVQIILFPEYGITGFDQTRDSMVPYLEKVPDPSGVDWIPCIERDIFPNTEVQTFLSCIARNSSIYIVANMGSIRTCDIDEDALCPEDGRYQFNTNVVFDSNGQLIVRYHKHNLADESPLFDSAPKAEIAIFDTPFGRFGTIVCADLLYNNPTIKLIEEHGIENILLPSAWFNTPPFIIAIQMYEGFAKSLNVNLLAANCKHPLYNMAGSGIFTGQTIANYTGDNFEKEIGTLMTATVRHSPTRSKQPRKSSGVNYSQSQNYELSSNQTFQYQYLHDIHFKYTILSQKANFARICYNRVCCHLEYSFKKTSDDEFYALGVADGPVYKIIAAYFEICILRKCNGSDPESCNTDGVASAKSTFGRLVLQGDFNTDYTYPLVTTTPLDGGFDLAEKEYDFYRDTATIYSSGFVHPLLTVAILGRNYGMDVDLSISPKSAKSVQSNAGKIIINIELGILALFFSLPFFSDGNILF